MICYVTYLLEEYWQVDRIIFWNTRKKFVTLFHDRIAWRESNSLYTVRRTTETVPERKAVKGTRPVLNTVYHRLFSVCSLSQPPVRRSLLRLGPAITLSSIYSGSSSISSFVYYFRLIVTRSSPTRKRKTSLNNDSNWSNATTLPPQSSTLFSEDTDYCTMLKSCQQSFVERQPGLDRGTETRELGVLPKM